MNLASASQWVSNKSAQYLGSAIFSGQRGTLYVAKDFTHMCFQDFDSIRARKDFVARAMLRRSEGNVY